MKYILVSLVVLSVLSCAKYDSTQYSGTKFKTDGTTISEINLNVSNYSETTDLTSERNYNQMWGLRK